MKKLRLIIFAIFLQAALFALPSCTFFYGESADLTYPAMFDALWKDYNETYALFDVRGNRGGLTGNVTRISGRFCAENKVYAVSYTKNGAGKNDFGTGVELEIKKNGSWQYTKPVILLTNAQTMSAGEEFSMAMCSQPHVTQVGNHTCGVFSLALERCLANGWRYSVSVQKVTAPDGTTPEGHGIIPASENLILNPSASEDLQMQRAISLCGE